MQGLRKVLPFMKCKKCQKEIEDNCIYCKWCGKKQTKTAAPKALKRANGAGTVYKLSGRRKRPWVAAINKVVIGYYSEKTEAFNALEEAKVKGVSDGYNDTLEDVYERWKQTHYKGIGLKAQKGYETAWERLEPIKSKKFRTIKTADFQKIVNNAMTLTQNPKPLSRSGKEKIKILCSLLCQQAMQDEIINKNYAEFIKLDKKEKSQREIFTESDIEKLFKDNSNTSRIICTLIYTGFRINELFDIKCNDVNLLDNYIIGGEKTDAGKERIVPINKKIRPFIESWHQNGREYLITTELGNKIDAENFRKRNYYPLLQRLGISKKEPHCTRHTFASLMSSAGVNPTALKEIIGHANFSTTADFYIHKNIEELQEAINKI